MDNVPIKEENPAATRALLVVDDHELVRNMVISIFENAGFVVLSASSGVAALQLVREQLHEIGCVLQDLSMPKMPGEAVISEMLKIKSDLPIIVYSVDDEASAAQRLSGLNIAGYVQKPFEIEALVEKIRALMQSRYG